MPEVTHAAQTASPKTQAAAITSAVIDPNMSTEALEKIIESILLRRKAEAVEAAKPKEPDWAKITEKEAYGAGVYIPVIDHELPDYMNLKLKDTEYECVWASQDKRRLGMLLNTGYEYVKLEHIHPDFKLPLQFETDGLYKYMDVVALRVHKRILYGKRVQALQTSINQLSNRNRPPRARVKGSFDLGEPVRPTFGEFYESVV